MTGNQLDVIMKPIRALVDSPGASFFCHIDKYRRFLKKVLFADTKERYAESCGWKFCSADREMCFCKTSVGNSTAPDTWNLYATRDYTLKPHSLTRITVSGYQTRGDINVVLDGSKHLLFEKNIATPSMVSTYLTNEQRNKLSELLRKFSGAFHEDRQVDSREDECETQDFTGDHAPINQRAYRVSPTERRIIHEEVQKMLDEYRQPSEVLGHHHCARKKKDGSWRFCVDYRKLNSVTKKTFILCLVLTIRSTV
ncbi:transposon Ty3-I Gag-Pol polyprotein [Trichonephila clavipes]|nr:transposon Ty3-I Gag-Pol polyprotein [Trichonephila clavipes]